MSTSRSNSHTILIVEDESLVSMDLEMSLTRLGHAVIGAATSGGEAIEFVRREQPDLILMDIQLRGDLDGVATAEAINQQFSIPVIFVTANVNDETIVRARQAGSYGFLNKPFRPVELNATIEIALHQHQAGANLSAEKERLEERVQSTSEALGQTREELQALSRHLMTGQEEERARIARELHDDLGQKAALLCMQADLLDRELPPGLKQQSAAMQSGLDTLARDLREVSHKIHPSIIADLGLTAALEALISDFRSKGLSVRRRLTYVEGLPLDVSTSLYRIAQESLNNVMKYARDSTVQVHLTTGASEIKLRISDSGPGFCLGDVRRRGGLGLISMQERARSIRGNLLLTAESNSGTTVLVRVPLRS